MMRPHRDQQFIYAKPQGRHRGLQYMNEWPCTAWIRRQLLFTDEYRVTPLPLYWPECARNRAYAHAVLDSVDQVSACPDSISAVSSTLPSPINVLAS
jgi:hypothetical protein